MLGEKTRPRSSSPAHPLRQQGLRAHVESRPESQCPGSQAARLFPKPRPHRASKLALKKKKKPDFITRPDSVSQESDRGMEGPTCFMRSEDTQRCEDRGRPTAGGWKHLEIHLSGVGAGWDLAGAVLSPEYTYVAFLCHLGFLTAWKLRGTQASHTATVLVSQGCHKSAPD